MKISLRFGWVLMLYAALCSAAQANENSSFTTEGLQPSSGYAYREPSKPSWPQQPDCAAFSCDPVGYYFATWFQRVDEAQLTSPVG